MTVDSASSISLKGMGMGKAFSEICDSNHGGLVFCALYTPAVCAEEPEPRRTQAKTGPSVREHATAVTSTVHFDTHTKSGMRKAAL